MADPDAYPQWRRGWLAEMLAPPLAPPSQQRDPAKLGPPSPPHPWTLNWWIDNVLAFTPVGAGQGLAEAVDAFGRLPRNPTCGELLPAVGQGALAAVGKVPVVGPEVRAVRWAPSVQRPDALVRQRRDAPAGQGGRAAAGVG